MSDTQVDSQDQVTALALSNTEIAAGRTSLYLAYRLSVGTATPEELAEATRRLRADPVDLHRTAGGINALIPATGATAGIPGTWTPAGSVPPADLTGATGVVASPASAWTTGQHVVTRDGSRITWSGTNWVGGVAP